MYLLIAKMRRLISPSMANSKSNSWSPSSASTDIHSAIDPRHSDFTGMKPSWWPRPSKSTAEDDEDATWTARIIAASKSKKALKFEALIIFGILGKKVLCPQKMGNVWILSDWDLINATCFKQYLRYCHLTLMGLLPLLAI